MLFVIDEIALPALEHFNPDIIILQSGGDGFLTDPLTHLSYSIYGYKEAAERLKSLDKPVAMLGGGGYDLDVLPIIWGVVYSILVDHFNSIEEDYQKLSKIKTKQDENAWRYAKKIVDWLKRKHPFLKEAITA